MNKLPTKQIYLLIIIIVGIFTLSVYSTYAIFTFEGETSDIVSIHTPNSLEISQEMYEYKQLTIEKNSYLTTDIDIYNTHEQELCYSIWYKTAGKDVDQNKIKIYQYTKERLSTTGVINPMGNIRVPIIITNDNDEDTKVNIGIAFSISNGTCELNISNDKLTVKSTLSEIKELSDNIIKNVVNSENQEPYYRIYKNNDEPINLTKEKVYVSDRFTYKDELFTLTEAILIDAQDISKYISTDEDSYYTCIDKSSCKYMYKINKIEQEEVEKNNTTNEKEYLYKITNYDTYEGFLEGNSGIKEIKTNNITNYLYFGDNPNNYLYYNCKDETNIDSCELWRIIGVYYDKEEQKYITKIIKDSSIGKYQYNIIDEEIIDEEITDEEEVLEENSWSNSSLFEYLNKEYEVNYNGYLKDIKLYEEVLESTNVSFDKITNSLVDIEKIDFIKEELENEELEEKDRTKLKFTIMSLSDYLNASTCENKTVDEYDIACLNNNWLNRNLIEWTQTKNPYTEEVIVPEVIPEEETTIENTENEEVTETEQNVETEETTEETELPEVAPTEIIINDKVFSVSTKIESTLVTEKLSVRPVAYLKSRILISSGDGSFENPYIIK